MPVEATEQSAERIGQRLAYVSGPVNAEELYDRWTHGKDPAYFGTSYLQQLYSYAIPRYEHVQIVTTLPGCEYRYDEKHVSFHSAPIPEEGRGIGYHLRNMLWAFRLGRHLKRQKFDTILLTAGQNYWFVIGLVFLFSRTNFVISYHCTVWPQFHVKKSWAILYKLNSWFILNRAKAIMGVSNIACEQARSLLRDDRIPVFRFLPTYRPEHFGSVPAARWPDGEKARILFLGRIERNKGVFDLLEIAEIIRRTSDIDFQIDICGGGPDLPELEAEIHRRGLDEVVRCHGVCHAEEVIGFYRASTIAIIPTTSQFEEGTPKTCIEAALARRPQVTSKACPALYDVFEAAIEAKVDDPESYAKALIELATNRELFETKVREAEALSPKFLDPENSYGAKLAKALSLAR